MRWKSRCGLSNRLETFFRKTGEIPQRGISPFRSARSFASRKPCPLASSPSCSRNFLAFCYYGFICPAKLVEGISLAGACERDWREHEENFSRNLSVPRQTCAKKEFGRIWRIQLIFCYKTTSRYTEISLISIISVVSHPFTHQN